MIDQVNHPPHYTAHPSGIEAIEICELLGFNVGCAFKYLFRRDAKHKDPSTDLKKAVWYTRREALSINNGIFTSVSDLPLPTAGELEPGSVFWEFGGFTPVVSPIQRVIKHEPPLIAAAMAYLVRGYECQDAVDLFIAAHYMEKAIDG